LLNDNNNEITKTTTNYNKQQQQQQHKNNIFSRKKYTYTKNTFNIDSCVMVFVSFIDLIQSAAVSVHLCIAVQAGKCLLPVTLN
jgi:hypothetical protein